MKKYRFEWDSRKATINLRKHGVSFEEAASAFYDEFAIEFFDTNNSEMEDRFLLLGLSSALRLILVCHCLRETGDVLRIISARKATKNEAKQYKR
ncbi:MAG: BrnT family toxin [Kiritimatiellae bacterium]|jgi:uncharacterized DUF497 family protein|nr:BrnT family toxin [Kiritimatiellia bacterium]